MDICSVIGFVDCIFFGVCVGGLVLVNLRLVNGLISGCVFGVGCFGVVGGLIGCGWVVGCFGIFLGCFLKKEKIISVLCIEWMF